MTLCAGLGDFAALAHRVRRCLVIKTAEIGLASEDVREDSIFSATQEGRLGEGCLQMVLLKGVRCSIIGFGVYMEAFVCRW